MAYYTTIYIKIYLYFDIFIESCIFAYIIDLVYGTDSLFCK